MQRRLIADWLKANGHPPASRKDEIKDEGLSAGHLLNLTEGNLGREIEKLKKKKIKPGSVVLVFAYTSRFSRANVLKASNVFTEVLLANIDLAFAVQNIHLSNGESEQTTYMKLGMVVNSLQQARDEWLGMQAKTRQVYVGHRERWKDFQSGKGAKPKRGSVLGITTWWQHQPKEGLIQNKPKESKTVQKIFDLYESGLSTRAIAKKFNDEGSPKNPVKRKKRRLAGGDYQKNSSDKWTASSILYVLKHRTVIGEYECWTLKKEEDDSGKLKRIREKVLNEDGTHLILKKYCPTIISKKQWNKVQAMLAKNPRVRKTASTKYPTNVFRGLLFDGYTNRSFTLTMSGGKNPALLYRSLVDQTQGGYGVTFNAKKFEESFFKIYCQILESEHLFKNWAMQQSRRDEQRQETVAEIEEQIRDKKDAVKNLIELIAKGNKSASVGEAIEGHEKEIEELEIKKEALAVPAPNTGETKKFERLLRSMRKFDESETKRLNVSKMLQEIGLKVWVWPRGFEFDLRVILKKFKAVHPALGKKTNWSGLTVNLWKTNPFRFLQEFCYWRFAVHVKANEKRWAKLVGQSDNPKTPDAMSFMFESVLQLFAPPVEQMKEFFDTASHPIASGNLVFVCEKPDKTFFGGILQTKKYGQRPLQYMTNHLTFTTLEPEEEWPREFGLNRTSGDASLDELEKSVAKLFKKIFKNSPHIKNFYTENSGLNKSNRAIVGLFIQVLAQNQPPLNENY